MLLWDPAIRIDLDFSTGGVALITGQRSGAYDAYDWSLWERDGHDTPP